MRMTACAVAILLASTACDKDEPKATTADAAAASPSGVPGLPTFRPDAAAAASTAATPSTVTMPTRPVPKPSTDVSMSAPEETQMKASAYMAAMRAPHLDDASIDDTWVSDLTAKLRPVVLAMDSGPDKARWNRIELVAKGRQIDLLMSAGCDAKAPFNAVVQRANVPLATLLSHGVLVVRCNDTKRQCFQSTRDPEDVLCTTAPRHK